MKIHPLALKVILIGAVIGLLMIGIGLITELVNEREGRHREAAEEIGASWGHPQVVAGPYLRLRLVPDSTDKALQRSRHVIILPESLACATKTQTEERHRGIYSVQLYSTMLKATGSFVMPDLRAMGIDTASVLWDQTTVEFCVSDTRGITTPLAIEWNGLPFEMHPSSEKAVTAAAVGRSGATREQQVISTRIHLAPNLAPGSVLSEYSIGFSFHGSEALHVVPVGKTTFLTAMSNWPHPSFEGSILPTSHVTTDQGFNAEWKSGHFARSYPQAFVTWGVDPTSLSSSAFGVSFVEPANLYQQLQRSVKYVVLVVLFIFALFFTLEVVSKRRIHAMQYLLVGFALLVFYLLLIAFSEAIRFDMAFLSAATAVTTLVSIYMRSVTKTQRYAFVVGGLLSTLYVFIYIMLQAETYSLLIGAIGMFLAIAMLMFTTRNIDWYAYGGETT